MKALAAVLALAAVTGGAAAAAPTDETLVILHKWGESLGAYDAATGARRGGLIRMGSVPHEMVLAPDGRWLYASNYGVKTYTDTAPGANTISVVDLSRGQKVGEVDLGAHRRPHGMALGRSGRLYVTTDAPAGVLVVDTAARKVAAFYPLATKLPHMLAVRRDESAIYVANSGSASVTVLRPAGGSREVAVGGVPMGVALSEDERRLYVANRDGNAVVVVDTAAERVAGKVALPGAPARVEVVPGDRQLVVTLIEAGDVALVDARTLTAVRRRHVGGRAEGLFVDPRGRFTCVSAQEDNKVIKLALPTLETMAEIATDARPDPIVLLPRKLVF
jgi:YVTN family beta-propeller protein